MRVLRQRGPAGLAESAGGPAPLELGQVHRLHAPERGLLAALPAHPREEGAVGGFG